MAVSPSGNCPLEFAHYGSKINSRTFLFCPGLCIIVLFFLFFLAFLHINSVIFIMFSYFILIFCCQILLSLRFVI